MKIEEKRNTLNDIESNIIFCDGFDEALIGYCDSFDKTIAIYDKEKIIEILMNRENFTEDIAQEFYEFNIIGAYTGELNPGFITYL